jgi:hypothetical protein
MKAGRKKDGMGGCERRRIAILQLSYGKLLDNWMVTRVQGIWEFVPLDIFGYLWISMDIIGYTWIALGIF